MNNLSILIIENDIKKALGFESLVQLIGYQSLGIVDEISISMDFFQQHKPDLVLMSTNTIFDTDTKENIRLIQELGIPILYITNAFQKNEKEAAIPAKGGVYFLNRPLQRGKLRAAIELAITHIKKSQMLSQSKNAFATAQDIYVKKKGVYYRILLQDIIFIQAANNHVIIQTEDEQFITQTRLRDMQKLVKGEAFFKVHRSYLANLKKALVVNFKTNTIKVAEYDIPISRSAKSLLRKKVVNFEN